MPTSAKTFDKEVEKLLRKYISKGMTRFLDIGAGSGKYGKMLDVWDRGDFRVEAIEPDVKYRDEYGLHQIYNYVYHQSVHEFIEDYRVYCTNVVIFGDILEHLPKSADRCFRTFHLSV